MFNVKRNDNVIMLQGKDRGKQGKVLFVLSEDKRIVVEGLNTVKKHQKPKKQGQKGQIVTKERAVDISNVQLVCPKCSKPTRVGHAFSGDKKYRVCKHCQAEI